MISVRGGVLKCACHSLMGGGHTNHVICICREGRGLGLCHRYERRYERASSFITQERYSNKSPTVVGDLIASAAAEIGPDVPGLLFSSSTYTRVKD